MLKMELLQFNSESITNSNSQTVFPLNQVISDVIIDAGCCQKCKNDVETSDLLAATSSGCATQSQKLNMFSLSELVAGSRCVYTTQQLCC